MNGLKNLAGNDVSIFLFRFEFFGNRMDFVINEAIGEDMYPDLDEQMKPLAHACCETLARYRHLSMSNTIMDGNILDTGEFEVMLSRGLGRYFREDEKQNLFQDAKKIADILIEVMERAENEPSKGKKRRPARMLRTVVNEGTLTKGLEELAQAKCLQAELEWETRGQLRPNLKQLRQENLPRGVTASRGYDHRGHCYVFEHKTHGNLGKIVLIEMSGEQIALQSDFYFGPNRLIDPLIEKRKKVFERAVAIVERCFKENFPEEPSP